MSNKILKYEPTPVKKATYCIGSAEVSKLLIPSDIAMFTHSQVGIVIEWRNPFEDNAHFKISNEKGGLIYSLFINNRTFIIPLIEKHLRKSYTIEIKNISTSEIKLYSVAY